MKIDICISRLNDNVYLGSYSISGWTSPMSFTGNTESHVVSIIKENIRKMFAQEHINMYTLDFPDINFIPVNCDPKLNDIPPIRKKRGRQSKKQVDESIPKRKRGRPKKTQESPPKLLTPKKR